MNSGSCSQISSSCNCPIRSLLEYAPTVFDDLPKYLACYLDNVQKRAFSITLLGIWYETALNKAAVSTLSDLGQSRVLNL